jgi:hypothetical protein
MWAFAAVFLQFQVEYVGVQWEKCGNCPWLMFRNFNRKCMLDFFRWTGIISKHDVLTPIRA